MWCWGLRSRRISSWNGSIRGPCGWRASSMAMPATGSRLTGETICMRANSSRACRRWMEEFEVMDETKGAATMNLPAEAVRDVIISRVTPEVFQSLNAAGAVRVSTRSGGDEWHGNLFGGLQDKILGLAGFPSGSDYSRQLYGFGGGGAVIKDKAFLFIGGERTKQDGFLPTVLGF